MDSSDACLENTPPSIKETAENVISNVNTLNSLRSPSVFLEAEVWTPCTSAVSLRDKQCTVIDFILNIVTGYESWVHHYDPEEKSQSTEYRHASSPRP
uniref:Uncharacterized protein n=1 Tax=Rhodnius prolixus TaxID=13249 RepID=T1HSB1_RHOPR